MIEVDKIEDAIINLIKSNIGKLKTVDTYEADYDQREVAQLLLLTDYILVHYSGGSAVEGERFHSGESTVREQGFHFYIGSKSLRQRRDSQLGCYSILNQLEKLFDGKTVDVISESGEESFRLQWVNEEFVTSIGGLIVYRTFYKFYQN